MSENFENYSETNWANEILIKITDQFPDNESRVKFRGLLDKNHIKEEEFYDFFNAYKNGSEMLKSFLNKRHEIGQESPEEMDQAIKFPTKEGKKDVGDTYKQAA